MCLCIDHAGGEGLRGHLGYLSFGRELGKAAVSAGNALRAWLLALAEIH